MLPADSVTLSGVEGCHPDITAYLSPLSLQTRRVVVAQKKVAESEDSTTTIFSEVCWSLAYPTALRLVGTTGRQVRALVGQKCAQTGSPAHRSHFTTRSC